MSDVSDRTVKRALIWLGNLRLLLVGVWIGAAIFFSFGVAPAVFGVLSSREMAGAVVQRTLAIVNVTGFVIGLLALLTAIPFRRLLRPIGFWAEVFLLGLMTAAAGIGHWVIAARMHALREQMVLPIDLIPPTDAVRVAFNQLHGYSVGILTAAMVSALTAWLLVAGHLKITSLRTR